MIVDEKNLLLNAQKNVVDLVIPLLKILDVGCFSFGRYFNDGRHLVLNTEPSWVELCYKKDYYQMLEQQKLNVYPYGFKRILWKSSNLSLSAEYMKDVIKAGYANSFTILENCGAYTDGLHFCVYDEDLSKCFFYIDYIEKFMQFFKNETARFLIAEEKNAFHINKKLELLTNTEASLSYNSDGKLNVLVNDECIMLTEQETRCASFLVEGKSCQEIAKMLHLSRRTVESYLENIKRKLNCNYKNKLVNVLLPYQEILKIFQLEVLKS